MESVARNLRNERPSLTARGRRMGIGAAMMLIAGLAFGLWLASTSIRPVDRSDTRTPILVWSAFFLGGLSLVGPPLLLMERRRRREGPPWGAGKVLWFSTGTASWLLWPPVVVSRSAAKTTLGPGPASEICYLYGTPLMALYVTLAMLSGGWLTKRRRKRMRRSWHETFGLLLGLAWACTGLYVLEMLYEADLIR